MISPTIQTLKIDQLNEPAENPNHMEDAQFDLLVGAIKRFGFLQPVLVRPVLGSFEFTIVDGVHRVRAAKACNLTEVPCVVLDETMGADDIAAALQIGMNRLRGELNLGDVSRTLLELQQLHDWSLPDLTLIGFTEGELDELLKATQADPPELGDMTLGPDPEPEDTAGKTYTLELVFSTKEELTRARKALRKAAGKGRELGDGLLVLLDQCE